MVTLNKPSAGNTDWATEVNNNWTTIENNLSKNAFQARLEYASTTTVELQAHNGDQVFVNGEMLDLSTALSLATTDHLLSSSGTDSGGDMAASTLYYVYVSNSSASYAASDLRASATAPSEDSDGVKYLATSGNGHNWRYVGLVYSNSSTQCADSTSARHVASFYNRIPKPLLVAPGYSNNNATTTFTYGATSWGAINGGTNDSATWLDHADGWTPYFFLTGRVDSSYSGVAIAIGIDSATSPTRTGAQWGLGYASPRLCNVRGNGTGSDGKLGETSRA